MSIKTGPDGDLLIVDGCTPRIASATMFDRIYDAGITACCVSLAGQLSTDFWYAIDEMHTYFTMEETYNDKCAIIRTAADIEQAKADKKVGIIFALQNSTPYQLDPVKRLPVLYRSGLRMVQLTYNEHNDVGSGCMEKEDRGLTVTGRQAVHEMHHLGIVIDLSHVGERTSYDAIELSPDPCVFSHANCAALTPHVRNKSDEIIKALAAKGGLIGLTPYAPFVESTRFVRPNLDDWFRHLEHAVELVGPDHVGIGTDIAEHWTVRWNSGTPRRYPELTESYTWETIYTEGFHTLGHFPAIVQAMLKRGYSETDVRKIMGENWLRIYRKVWRG